MTSGRHLVGFAALVAGWLLAAPVTGLPATRSQSVLIDPHGGLSTRDLFDKALADFDQAQRVQADDPDRARQLFRAAAQGFEAIVAAGRQTGSPVVNGRLEFNLANSYLQAGDVGLAILHYRRAQRLIPRDELLKENLEVARSRCLTMIHPTRRSVFLRSALFWHYETSLASRIRGAIVFYVAFWLLLTARNFMRSGAMVALVIGCAVLTVTLGVSVASDRWSDRNAPGGVVTTMDVVVHKGPGLGYQRQFEQPLQPGVEFTLRQRRGNWWDIELPDGQTGWIEAATAELIPTGRT